MNFHWFDHLADKAGAIHVHTVKSNGAGTLQEVVSAAERSGLSFLIITDHDTRGYGEEGEEGWHGDVFVLAGEEITVGSGRFIILGHAGEMQNRSDIVSSLTEARAHGALTIAVPPEDETSQLSAPSREQTVPAGSLAQSNSAEVLRPPVTLAQGAEFPMELVDGWEFWCGLEDWARGRMDRKPTTNPFERQEHVGLRGPRRGAIRIWDNLAQRGHILGFAGLNAHGRSWASTSPGAALPYETLFRSLTTHVLTPELPKDDPDIARSLLLKSMRQGHFHTVQSCVASPVGFRFVAEVPHSAPLLEGDSGVFHPKARLRVRLPRMAEIKILQNGALLLTAEGDALDVPVVTPGAYRVEAWVDRRPWIFSNPIWFAPASEKDRLLYRQQSQSDIAKSAHTALDDLLDLAT